MGTGIAAPRLDLEEGLTLRRVASRPHPCDPWTNLVPAVARNLLPGGWDASRDALERRTSILEGWRGRVGWTSAEAADLRTRVRIGQGLPAARELDRILSGSVPVVLTGQQPVLGGGPLFVWLKARTAILQSRSLSLRLGIPVHPVFWIAGDDSDLPEVRHLADPLLARTWDAFPGSDPESRIPVGGIPLPDPARVAGEIRKTWPTSALPDLVEGSGNLSELLLSCLRHWFGDELLVLDAGWPELRTMARAAYAEFASKTDSVFSAVEAGIGASRAAGLRADLGNAADRTRLFRLGADGLRRRVVLRGGDAADASGWSVPADRLAAEVERCPASFSHDAGSRPFCAEEVLPVLAHVLGPGEFAYFSCLGDLGRILSRPLAPALPRASATILPAGPWDDARLAGWDPRFAAMPWKEIESTLLRALSPEWTSWGRRWRDARSDYLDELGLAAEDPRRRHLDGRLASAERSILASRLRERAEPHKDRIRRLRGLWALAGGGRLQERVVPAWALEFHLESPDLLPSLGRTLDPDDPTHGVWEAR